MISFVHLRHFQKVTKIDLPVVTIYKADAAILHRPP